MLVAVYASPDAKMRSKNVRSATVRPAAALILAKGVQLGYQLTC